MPILTLVGTGDKLLISTGNPLLVKLLCAYVQNFGRDVAQLGSALVWGTRGRWFESSRPDHSFLAPVFLSHNFHTRYQRRRYISSICLHHFDLHQYPSLEPMQERWSTVIAAMNAVLAT